MDYPSKSANFKGKTELFLKQMSAFHLGVVTMLTLVISKYLLAYFSRPAYPCEVVAFLTPLLLPACLAATFFSCTVVRFPSCYRILYRVDERK